MCLYLRPRVLQCSRANPLQTEHPITQGKGDAGKLIPVLTQRVKNDPTNSIVSPKG